MVNFRFLLSCCWLLCFVMNSVAQKKYSYQQININDGLSSSYTNRIYQDHDQLIWFATWDGLNVYDGSLFRVFNYNKPGSNNILGSNMVYQITEDRQHNIWLGTAEGVSRYHKSSGRISNYFYNTKTSGGFFLALDSTGVMYAAPIDGNKLYVYQEKADTFIPCAITGLSKGHIKKLALDGMGRLWIFKDNNLLVYKKNGAQLQYITCYDDAGSIENLLFTNGHIFFTTNNKQLWQVGSNLIATKRLDLPSGVKSMTLFKKSYLLAWDTKGIGEYDLDFKAASDLSLHIPQLKSIAINNLCNTNNNILWCATDGNGIVKITSRENYFRSNDTAVDKNAHHASVRAFCQVDPQTIWAGAKNSSIIAIHDKGKAAARFENVPMPADLAGGKGIYAMARGKDNITYIGTDKGICLYVSGLQKFLTWKTIEESLKIAGPVRAIYCDTDSSVWAGTDNGGLLHFKLALLNNRFRIVTAQCYNYTGNEHGPAGNTINAIVPGKDGRLWLACRFAGLSVLNRNTGVFINIKSNSYRGSISNNDVLSLHPDHRGNMWIGTSYGLNQLPEASITTPTPVFRTWQMEDGLPNSIIHGIAEDNNGYIWISTNRGLGRINPDTTGVALFKIADGLQSDEFCDNAVLKTSSGNLYFGNVNGLNYCTPQNIRLSNPSGNLLISDLQMGGNLLGENALNIINTLHPRPVAKYTLPQRNNFFECRIKAISYFNEKKFQYAYLLEGNDNKWHYLGDDHRISYSNLPPGRYRLKIRWSSGEGAWSKDITTFEVTVKPYLLLSLPAFIAYFLLLAIISYAGYRYRSKRLDMQHHLEMEHALRKKDEEQHEKQLDFFTNIAHELKTPLSLITGCLDRYFSRKAEPAADQRASGLLDVVNQQAVRLSHLVHQLLDFRRAEAGYLGNSYSYFNVSALFSGIVHLFIPLAEEKNLTLGSHIAPDIFIWSDKDKLEKIFFNLLSNACKHAPQYHEIKCILRLEETDHSLHLHISNSGCKLTTAEYSQLFTQFFIANQQLNSAVSSGLGLAFINQLVKLLKGNISTRLENNWLSFDLKIPVSPPEKTQSCQLADNEPSHVHKIMVTVTGNMRAAKAPAVDNQQDNNRKTILVIDDEPGVLFLLNDILRDTYTVVEASNGKQAIDLLQKITPHLIICDVMMPDMNGLTLSEHLKGKPATCHIPLILLSARQEPDDQLEGYEAGADAYITKPFNPTHLLIRIRKLFDYCDRVRQLFAQDRIIPQVAAAGLKPEDQQFITRTIQLIEDNLEKETLDAAFLEKELGMSKAYFYKRIKLLSDMTPGELIKHFRLKKASTLLQSSDLSVSEIFYQSGFSTESYFFREFKKKYELSPGEYRLKFRVVAE